MELLRNVGQLALGLLEYLRDIGRLFGRTLRSLVDLRPAGLPILWRVTLTQLLFTGAHAVVPLTIASMAVGTLVIYETIDYLPVEYVQEVTSAILVREVVPLLTAFLLIGRSGTAITIEVGSMKINDELAALTVMGIPFEHYVMLPRLVGMIVAFVLLQFYANVAAVVGGYYATEIIDGHPLAFPVQNLFRAIEPADVGWSVLKVVLFGVVVSLTSVSHGLGVRWSRREIPIATTRALVRSLLLCFVLNTAVSLSA